jgi:hypothetical protein
MLVSSRESLTYSNRSIVKGLQIADCRLKSAQNSFGKKNLFFSFSTSFSYKSNLNQPA